MGGSRRRLKKTQPKVKVGTSIAKRKKIDKTKLPLEVTDLRLALEKRLNTSVEWEEEKNLQHNYEANQLIMDPNQGFGRNKRSVLTMKSKEQRKEAGEEAFDDDDELRAGCNLERKTGKADLPRLTSHQRAIIEKLVNKHGDDLKAMVLDIKLNAMQHSAGQLRKLIDAFRFWSADSRHDFRAPRKQPKKLF